MWRHGWRLKRHVIVESLEYQHYLETQLRRSLSRKRAGLETRSRVLIDKTADLIDLSHCEVLCVGCRNRAEVEYFRDKGASSVVGIDLHSESTDILVMDMHQMIFPDEHFDVVYCSHSLEHAYDVGKVVSEIVRVARSGAAVAIEVPVKYETRGADLVDFGSVQNLQAAFAPHIAEVLLSAEQPSHSHPNQEGTAVVRTVFSIFKSSDKADESAADG